MGSEYTDQQIKLAAYLRNLLLAAKTRMALQPGWRPAYGICSILYSEKHHREELDALLLQAFLDWPEFSGELSFPVRNYSWGTRILARVIGTPVNGLAFVRSRNLWSKYTRYGRARHRLLNHTILWLDQHIETLHRIG